MKLYSIIPTLPVYVYNLHNISVKIQILWKKLFAVIKQKKKQTIWIDPDILMGLYVYINRITHKCIPFLIKCVPYVFFRNVRLCML